MKASQTAAKLPPRQSSKMAHIVSTAKRLREVRKASRQFLLLWSFERGHYRPGDAPPGPDTALADHANHDWSLLYEGSVLDD